MITRLLLGEPFPWEAEPLPLCEPLPWELEPLPPCESFASEPELSQTFVFCVTVREPDSKIFVTDLQPAFAGATKEVNTAAAAAIVSPIFLMTLSSENVLRSPAGKITQSCRHHCENGHTGSQFVVHHGHVAVHSACPGGVKRVRGCERRPISRPSYRNNQAAEAHDGETSDFYRGPAGRAGTACAGAGGGGLPIQAHHHRGLAGGRHRHGRADAALCREAVRRRWASP